MYHWQDHCDDQLVKNFDKIDDIERKINELKERKKELVEQLGEWVIVKEARDGSHLVYCRGPNFVSQYAFCRPPHCDVRVMKSPRDAEFVANWIRPKDQLYIIPFCKSHLE